MLTPEQEEWLNEIGYEYHCFISWPHITDHEIADSARRIKRSIEDGLGYSIARPRVFLDEASFTVGDEWREKLSHALCRSMSMIALCAPIYYHPEHPWCGVEWAAMEALGAKRLPGVDFKPIMPIILRERSFVPPVVAKFQYEDFSRVSVQGRRYFSTNECRSKMNKIVARLLEIAETLAVNKRAPDCQEFKFPQDSAFSEVPVEKQTFPFRGVGK